MKTIESQAGKPYVWGADGPDAFDCSGLIVYGLRRTGGITQSTDYDAASLIDMTQKLTIDQAIGTRGAFLYLPGHIAVSRGDGTTIEARNPKLGVLIDTAQGRGWTLAGILPQFTEGNTMCDGKMASPVAGTVSCEWHGYANHAGIDIACNTGTPVYAAYAGTVEKVGTNIVSGRTGIGVLIRNPDGEAQYYGHLSQALVSKGQKVALGTKIALSGATGNVTGPHLHFETWNAGANGGVGGDVNPRIHFNSHGVTPGSTTGQKTGTTTASSSSFLPLAIDGDESHRTITEEERALKKAGFYTGVIEADYGKTAVRGPMLKEAEQKWLKARGQYTRAIDRDFGTESVKAEQRQLSKLGHYSQSIDGNTRTADGDRGSWTIKGLQAALNSGAVK